MSNETDDNEDDDSVTVDESPGQVMAFLPGRGPGRPPGPPNVVDPVTNDEPMPCFPNAARKDTRQAQHMIVEKLDPPYDGHKGTVPHTSTKEYIAGLYGDGIYKLSLVNSRNQVIKVADGIKISVGIHPTQAGKQVTPEIASKVANPTTELGGLLQILISKLEKDDVRGDGHTTRLIDTAKDMATQHANSVIQSSKESSAREQEYHKTQMAAQEQLYKAFMTMFTENAHIMQTRIMNEHERSMAALTAAHERQLELQDRTFNQMLTLTTRMNEQEKALLKERLQFELEHSESENTESPWLAGLSKGIEGIKELRQLAEHAGAHTKTRSLQDKVRNLKKLQMSSVSIPQNAGKPRETAPNTNQHRTTMKRVIPQSSSSEPTAPAETESESDNNLG